MVRLDLVKLSSYPGQLLKPGSRGAFLLPHFATISCLHELFQEHEALSMLQALSQQFPHSSQTETSLTPFPGALPG